MSRKNKNLEWTEKALAVWGEMPPVPFSQFVDFVDKAYLSKGVEPPSFEDLVASFKELWKAGIIAQATTE